MVMVDSSVWVDYFNGVESAEVEYLNERLGQKPIAAGDLILAEVLQGFRYDKDVTIAKELFNSVRVFGMVGEGIAIKSAENYRTLRSKGVTVRKTVDCIIATYCMEHELPLLQTDKDFEAFHEHLNLRRALQST